MEIFIERENKTQEVEIEKPTTLKSILDKLGISNESVILVRNDEIVLEEEEVNNKDKIKLLSVVSGG